MNEFLPSYRSTVETQFQRFHKACRLLTKEWYLKYMILSFTKYFVNVSQVQNVFIKYSVGRASCFKAGEIVILRNVGFYSGLYTAESKVFCIEHS